jgi:hypothetical protein
MSKKTLLVLVLCSFGVAGFLAEESVYAGRTDSSKSDYQVLEPIRQGNLEVFPVVTAVSYDTSEFLTLDEGLKSGDVVVTEYGKVQGLVRRRPSSGTWDGTANPGRGGAQVNTLVLVNNSKRPLILLAGEIVTGGKQDRVIAKDRIVPAESDPIDLGVFCVEPGRWVASSEKFGGLSYSMAAPSVRGGAMGDKSQEKVWAKVKQSQNEAVEVLALPAPAAREVQQTSSYARVMQNSEVKKSVDAVAEPVQRNYESVIRQLKDRNAVGVVAAVNGQIVWADIFASTSLLQKYWPKLVRSYASEAVVTKAKGAQVTTKQAEQFLADMQGRHETTEREPGLYSHTEVTGDGFKAFELTSLLPKAGFEVHIAKMTD